FLRLRGIAKPPPTWCTDSVPTVASAKPFAIIKSPPALFTPARTLPMSRFCLLTSLACAITFAFADGSDWPRFRGPNGNGVAEGPLPDIDPAKPLWKTKIPGKGVSSPIVIGGKIYLQSASLDGKTRMLICVNPAKGNIEWTKELGGEKAKAHAK